MISCVMMNIHAALFCGGALLLAFVFARQRDVPSEERRKNSDFDEHVTLEGAERALHWRYIFGYLPAIFGDWLIGGHLYALYASYGYSMKQIGILYIVGYASSATLGTVASAMLDGRKGCLAHCAFYVAACLCLEFPQNFAILCAGRCFGGVGTSLLYASFESWVLQEHARLGMREEALQNLYSACTVYSALSAIAAGLIAEAAVVFTGSLLTPFRLALAPLAIGACVISVHWKSTSKRATKENSSLASAFADISNVARQVALSPAVRSICLLAAVFESCMFIFVSFWTPFLQSRLGNASSLRHGVVFSLFMLFKMCGSYLFSLLKGRTLQGNIASRLIVIVFVSAAMFLFIPSMVVSSYEWSLTSYCLYEICIGMYWPLIASLRSQILTKSLVHKFISLFRIPLNGIVISSIYLVSDASRGGAGNFVVACCSFFLASVGLVAKEPIKKFYSSKVILG